MSQLMSLQRRSRFTIDELLIVIVIAASVAATTTDTAVALKTIGRRLIHVPVTIVFQSVKDVLTVRLHQVCPRLPKWVNDIVYEANL